MATARKEVRTQVSPIAVQHPLDPLTPDEIEDAVAILRADRSLGKRVRFETVVLNEPPKAQVLRYKDGDPIQREAFIALLDNDTGSTYEAVVSLADRTVKSWEHIPGVQPKIMLDEFYECEEAVKRDPTFREALEKRGITDIDLVMVDPWSAGSFGIKGEEGLRLSFARCWLRSSPTDNGYARPIEGVIPVVDLNRMEVLRVEDHGVVPLPPNSGNFAAEFVREFRADLKPLEITQPEGPSFQVDGHQVSWQKWGLRVGFTPREGLIL
ncbi:MAG: tyramine oxidase, partial [Dehalococcoidia bacterium]